ncbi:uncharacterized protein [Thunnus thynnus]|uniref:uncharacterized protein isoform X2 n=1 Tax=Thunnus thynnus TaxID=8237 RepID=UPI003527380B
MENAQISSDKFDIESLSEDRELKPIDMAITPVMLSHLHKITEQQWKMLATAHTDTDTIKLLSSLCQDVVEVITSKVGDVLLTEAHTIMHEIESSNTSTTMIDVSKKDWSDYILTEEVLELVLGNSLHACLGTVMGVMVERYHNSDELLKLVAAEVTRRVNQSLAKIFPSTIFPQSPQSAGSDISLESNVDDMVYHTAQILHRCIWKRQQREEDSQFSEFSGPDEVTDVEEFNAEDSDSIFSTSKCSVRTFDIKKACPSPVVDVSQEENFSGPKCSRRISTFVKRVGRSFRRNTAKVGPACEIIYLENGSTPQPPKMKKGLSITRIFSSLGKILTKPFISCISGESQDD